MNSVTMNETVRRADPRGGNWARPSLVLGLIIAADFLLFDHPWGIGWFVFGVLLAAGIAAMHPLRTGERTFVAKAAMPALGLLPLVEHVSPLSIIVGLVGLALFALSMAGRLQRGMARAGRQLAGFFFILPFRLLADALRHRKSRHRFGPRAMRFAGLLVWTMPVMIGGIFVGLFGIANPVIEHWLARIDIFAWLAEVDFARVVFWLIAGCAIWAYLRPRLPRRIKRPLAVAAELPEVSQIGASGLADALFGRAALLRALVLFNVIFAVQTAMDAAYLWGGVALPDGLTYASYAHRGAYALIVTALLAAAFVLAAMRPGSVTSGDRLIRGLVYMWTAQNVWLVLSSILRLDLYVGIYSLTYWRIAAFLWMGLVATGLVLIIARIALAKSNEWLSSANLLTLSALTYACCFINFAALIANYNVDQSFEMTGQGLLIDQTYLRQLGPAAFPAIDRLAARMPGDQLCAYDPETAGRVCLAEARAKDEGRFRETARSWRGWTFRNWRLMRYLDGRPITPALAIPVEPAQ